MRNLRSGDPSSAHSNVLHLPGWNGTRQLIQAGKGVLYAVSVQAGTAGFLQLYDAAATGDVTLGTTTPVLSFAVTANAKDEIFQLSGGVGLLYYSRGLVAAFTTTRTGALTTTAASLTAITEAGGV